jgi:SAM-dependent methyltransferase
MDRAGFPDWEVHWRERVAQATARIRAMAGKGDDPFARLAHRLERQAGDPDQDPLLSLVAPLAEGARVLDVGAGVGRYTLPLASLAREVVAVEPSPNMRERLEARLRQRGIANVRVVPHRFEEAALEPADLVFCAHVVHLVADGAGFVRKADALAERCVAFAIRHDPMRFPAVRLWSRYRSDPPPREALFADLYNLLLQLGYAPNVTFYTRRYAFGYESVEEAREEASRLLGAPVSPEDAAALVGDHVETLREALVWWGK